MPLTHYTNSIAGSAAGSRTQIRGYQASLCSRRTTYIHSWRSRRRETSLAQTAAIQHQSSDQKPVLLTCDPSSGFYRIAHDMAQALCSSDPTVTKRSSSRKIGASLTAFLSGEAVEGLERGVIPEMRSINEAVAVIDWASRRHSKAPVVLVDEFERVTDPAERALFADLIKQLGDQSIPVKVLFCGVGSSLDDLLDTHHSCYRYLAVIMLERLSYDGRLEIIDAAMDAFKLKLDDSTRYRIARISDGFPHFVHLVCEKLLWQVYEDPLAIQRVKPEHFTFAIEAAVRDIEPHLKLTYEKAAKKYTDGYEEVLWAVADDKELSRRSSDIFDSHIRIMASRKKDPMTREKFNTRMNALKQPTHASILRANRQGWYEYSENIVRGYVRLRAAQQGVDLEVDHQMLARKY